MQEKLENIFLHISEIFAANFFQDFFHPARTFFTLLS